MSRVVKIIESDIPGPYNLLDLPDGKSITFIARSYRIGEAVREIRTPTSKERVKGKIMRVYVDLSTPVFGAPYLDILAGRTIALLKAIFDEKGLPIKLTLTASGKEPNKWYEVSFESLGSSPRPESQLPV